MVGMILVRSLYRDLARYNRADNMVSVCVYMYINYSSKTLVYINVCMFLLLFPSGGHARGFWLEIGPW